MHKLTSRICVRNVPVPVPVPGGLLRGSLYWFLSGLLMIEQVQSVLATLTQLEHDAQCSFFDLQRRFSGAAASA